MNKQKTNKQLKLYILYLNIFFLISDNFYLIKKKKKKKEIFKIFTYLSLNISL